MSLKQEYHHYTTSDIEVWQALFDRQISLLKSHASNTYLECMEELRPVLNRNKIPDFKELNHMLANKTGWSIEVVPGMIPVEEFFRLLSQRKFCSSTWLRTMEQLDYLEEPDMFHDIFGHIPLLANERFARFVEEFGRIGLGYMDDPNLLKKLQNLYWYTIEFGLISEQSQTKVYGAGIISSFGETQHVYGDQVERLPFNLTEILDRDFINSEIQNTYYVLSSLEDLYELPNKLKELLPSPAQSL